MKLNRFLILAVIAFILTIINEHSIEKTSLKDVKEGLSVDNVEKTSIDFVDDIINNIKPKQIVYDNMTLDELSDKLDNYLNSDLSGKGHLIASYSLEVGVDPYLVTAIMLVETGCKWKCSNLVKKCNNVGGQVGSGCGKYRYYDTLDDGIKGLIDYLYRGYISKGMTTAKEINTKYAQNKSWYVSVNKYIDDIKAQ